MLKKKCIVEATKKPHMPQAWKTPPPILAWLQLSCVLPEPEVNFWVPTLTSWAGLPGYAWLNPLVFTHYSKDGGFSIWNGVLWIFQNNTVVWIYTHTHQIDWKFHHPPPWKKISYKFLSEKSAFLRPSWEKKVSVSQWHQLFGNQFSLGVPSDKLFFGAPFFGAPF